MTVDRHSLSVLIDREGHIKLSDFGLSTGFHKTHDSQYYQRMLDNSNPSTKMEHLGTQKNIDITLSRQDRMATWKRNRRALVCGVVFGFDPACWLTVCSRRTQP